MSSKLNLIKVISIILFCLVLTGIPQPAPAAQFVCPPDYLRVALGLGLASADFAVSQGNYELVDYLTQSVISPSAGNGIWRVAPAGNTKIQVSQNGKALKGLAGSMVILRQKNSAELNTFRFKNKNYRGDLLIVNANGRLQMINVIDVEHYLYGVVGVEMGMGAPEEAYKAQAIVSRTYALYYKEHPQLTYDVGITTQYQVYGGYDVEVLSDLVKNAVDDTKGMVIYYDDQLIQAFFHANSGGHTESCENVWYNNLPYIQPVPAPEDAIATRVKQNGTWPADSYQWEKTFTRQELLDRIKTWNRENPDNAINIGEVQTLVASRQAVNPATREYLPVETRSRRVTQLDFIGSRGTKSFFRDNIRSVLGLKSTLFEVTFDSAVKIRDALGNSSTYTDTKSMMAVNAYGQLGKINGNNGNYYVITAEGTKTIPKQFTQVVISGKGYGHGLGMSQWGAWGMAAQGIDHRKIIEHFYNQNRNDGRLQVRTYLPG